MKAITVEPKKPGTARLEDVSEPEARDGSVLVEAIAVGVCGTDVESLKASTGGLLTVRRAWCWATNPWVASCTRALRRAQEWRSGGGDRPPSRPRPVPELRGGRVGHVSKRPVHGARHQADRRLHVRALADRARVRDEGGQFARAPRCPAGAHNSSHQSLGTGRRGRSARLLGTPDGADDRGGADRSARRPHRKAARAGRPRPRPGRFWTRAGARPRPRRNLPHRHRSRHRIRARHHRRMHTRRPGDHRLDSDPLGRAASSVSPALAPAARISGPATADVAAAAAAEQRRCWQRQCQQAALVQGRRSPGPCRPRVAGSARDAKGATERFARALQRQPDDIKVVVQFAEV